MCNFLRKNYISYDFGENEQKIDHKINYSFVNAFIPIISLSRSLVVEYTFGAIRTP